MAQIPSPKDDTISSGEKLESETTDSTAPKDDANLNSKDVRCRMCDAIIFKKGIATYIQSQSKIHGYTGKTLEVIPEWWRIENQNDFDNICGGGSKKADEKLQVDIENMSYPYEDYHVKYLACGGPTIQLSSSDININLEGLNLNAPNNNNNSSNNDNTTIVNNNNSNSDNNNNNNSNQQLQQQQLFFALQQLLSAQPLSDCEKTKGVIGFAVFRGPEFQKRLCSM